MFENLQKNHTRSSLKWTRCFCLFHCFNNSVFIDLRLFRFRSIFYVVSFFLSFRESVRHIIHSFDIYINVSTRMNSRIRWHRIEKRIDETKKNELKQKFWKTKSQKISREKRRWHFVFDQKEHCFSEIFKIIVAKVSNLKKKIMSRFQRKLSDNNFTDLNFCQIWFRIEFYSRLL